MPMPAVAVGVVTPYPAEESKRQHWFTTLVKALNNTPGNSRPVLFANLPVPVPGQMAVVTDSMVNTWGTTITGGGGMTVGAFYNGTVWTVMAK